jgi:hypothetical protein
MQKMANWINKLTRGSGERNWLDLSPHGLRLAACNGGASVVIIGKDAAQWLSGAGQIGFKATRHDNVIVREPPKSRDGMVMVADRLAKVFTKANRVPFDISVHVFDDTARSIEDLMKRESAVQVDLVLVHFEFAKTFGLAIDMIARMVDPGYVTTLASCVGENGDASATAEALGKAWGFAKADADHPSSACDRNLLTAELVALARLHPEWKLGTDGCAYLTGRTGCFRVSPDGFAPDRNSRDRFAVAFADGVFLGADARGFAKNPVGASFEKLLENGSVADAIHACAQHEASAGCEVGYKP